MEKLFWSMWSAGGGMSFLGRDEVFEAFEAFEEAEVFPISAKTSILTSVLMQQPFLNQPNRTCI